jgi:hypothetical protein
VLKEAIRMLDRGESPRDYVREKAKRCRVVED